MNSVVAMTSPAPIIIDHAAPIVVPDSVSDLTLVVASPELIPGLWDEYLDGARAAYSARGVEEALQYEDIRDGTGTRVFCAVIDAADRVVGGLRVQGPYTQARESHAVSEWEGQRGQAELIAAIGRRIPSGLIEVKSAFIDATSHDAAAGAGLLARTPLILMAATGTTHMLATAADYVLARWESGGGRVDSAIPFTPYPDDRYRTQAMFWDQQTLADFAEPEVWAAMCAEFASAGGLVERESADVA